MKISKVLDLYKMFSSIESMDDASKATRKLQDFLDVDGVAFVQLSICADNRININQVISSDFGVNDRNIEWSTTYQKNNFQYIDPVITCSLSHRKPFNWKSIPSIIGLDKKQTDFLGIAGEMGLKEGASIGSLNAKQISSELSITSVYGTSLNQEQLAVLELINEVSCKPLSKLVNPIDKLTPRELEVLAWSAEGKSSWEIGIICSISERTVKFHFKNIYQKLGVQNRAQAIVRAIKHDVI
ncbi:LuxR C-terminal-related transcriptional regulator [Aliivibrio kagoshimensis]|uniref:LuxR C-terminal-related transcriptional regulator n=1 Tax=Aliivibrio kagoshimensis TaxID=2910230 RepID=UPI003D11FDF6